MEEIVDKDTGKGVNWSTIFFRLHHYCNLNKWEIYNYTLPQITALLECVDEHIEFQVKITQAPFGMFGGGTDSSSSSSSDDTEYQEITEDDIGQLAKLLGGG
ncbi:hypothetical protein ACPA0F_18225 [Solibacillus silvestris]